MWDDFLRPERRCTDAPRLRRHWTAPADPYAIQCDVHFAFLCVPSQSGALLVPLHPQK